MLKASLKKAVTYGGRAATSCCALTFTIILGLVVVTTSIIWVPAMIISIITLFMIIKLIQISWLGPHFRELTYKVIHKLLFKTKIQQRIWNSLYNHISKRFKGDELQCMNYGYAVISKDGVYLDNYKTSDYVYQYQLYDYALLMVASIKDLKGKTMVEVGCGRGGCFKYVADEYKPKQAIGFDLSSQSIQYCNQKYTVNNETIQFYEADSQQLKNHEQVTQGMADVVINIESSHCYPDIEAFFDSVNYMLKDNGIFVFADFRPKDEILQLDNSIQKYFEIVKQEDIRRNVVYCLDLQHDIKNKALDQHVSWYMRTFMKNFLAVQDSKMYEKFSQDQTTYFIYALKKKVQ